jgi:hypothetical protein
MTKFVHLEISHRHAGVERVENAVSYLKASVKAQRPRLSVARLQASLLVTAIVAALLVAANQFIETVSDGHLFAAWLGLWAVGFAAMALLAQPAAALFARWRASRLAWREARRAAEQDRKFWQAALDDDRVMADLRGAMGAVGG